MSRRCAKCSCERTGKTCWKCSGKTFIPHEAWIEPKLPDVDRIRALAKEVGYAIGEHGSKERDLDLIAAPWTNKAVDHIDLVVHIADGMNGHLVGNIEKKPLGRVGYNIEIDGWFKIIDISVCPKLP